MRWDRVLNVVHAHAEGEVGRVMTDVWGPDAAGLMAGPT